MRRHRVAKRAGGQRLEVVERLQDMTRKSLRGCGGECLEGVV